MNADATPRAGEMAVDATGRPSVTAAYVELILNDVGRATGYREANDRFGTTAAALKADRQRCDAALARALPPARGVLYAYAVDCGNTGDGWNVRMWTASRRSEAEGTAKVFGVPVLPLYLAPDAGAGAASSARTAFIDGAVADLWSIVHEEDEDLRVRAGHDYVAALSGILFASGAAPAGGGLPGVDWSKPVEVVHESDITLFADVVERIEGGSAVVCYGAGEPGQRNRVGVFYDDGSPQVWHVRNIGSARLSAAEPGELTELDAGPHNHCYPIIDFDGDRAAFLADLRRDVEGGKLSGPCVVDPAALLAWAEGDAAGTGDAGRPSAADKITAGLDDIAAGRRDVVWIADLSPRIPARVADDLAYSAEIDAAIAEGRGSVPSAAPARGLAADGLRETGDLRPGLEEALRRLRHPNAGMEPPDGGSPSQTDRVHNVAEEIEEVVAGLPASATPLAAPSPDRGGATDGWSFDMGAAPYCQEVEIQVGAMQFRAELVQNGSLDADERSCDQWRATREGEHPPCWSGGSCWESNEDLNPSLQPHAWRLPTPAGARP